MANNSQVVRVKEYASWSMGVLLYTGQNKFGTTGVYGNLFQTQVTHDYMIYISI